MDVYLDKNDQDALKLMSDLINNPDHERKEYQLLADHFAAMMVGRYRSEMARREMIRRGGRSR
jgi:hypothetical protein